MGNENSNMTSKTTIFEMLCMIGKESRELTNAYIELLNAGVKIDCYGLIVDQSLNSRIPIAEHVLAERLAVIPPLERDPALCVTENLLTWLPVTYTSSNYEPQDKQTQAKGPASAYPSVIEKDILHVMFVQNVYGSEFD